MVTEIQPRTGRECPDCDMPLPEGGVCIWCFFGTNVDGDGDRARIEVAHADEVLGVEGCPACYGDPEVCDDADNDCDGLLFGDEDEP